MAFTQKQIEENTKKRIKSILKVIEADAIGKIRKALNSGALANDSEFFDDNGLLANSILETVFEQYKIKSPEYKKESQNLQLFL